MTTYRTPEVCTLTGATYRRLDRWAHLGVFGDHHRRLGSGTQRLWTADEVRAARVVRALSDLGAGVHLMAAVTDTVMLLDHHATHLMVTADGTVLAAPFPAVPDGACWIVDLVSIGAHRLAMADDGEAALC